MLDVDTLRVVQAGTAACTFLLVYLGTYRRMRAPFAGWWSAVVALSGASTALYLLGQAAEPWAAAAVGNGLAVAAAAMAWAAARSLRGRDTRWWRWATPGAVVTLASALEQPGGDAWPGGLALLVGMAVAMGLAAFELWALARERDDEVDSLVDAQAAIIAMAVASTVASGFYVVRAASYVALGPGSPIHQTWLGPTTTTLLVTLLLVVVTYSVAELSRYELAHRWRLKALRDDLTGLYQRDAFRDRAKSALAHAAEVGENVAVIVADLDHFKRINDAHGHAAGDRVLRAFGDACRAVLGADALAGRLGGEEFVVLLPGADAERGQGVAAAIDKAFESAIPDGAPWPTVSYGVAAGGGGARFDTLVERADEALYQAKRAGRDRTVVFGDHHGGAGTVSPEPVAQRRA